MKHAGDRGYASCLRCFAALAIPPEQRVLDHSIVYSSSILVGATAARTAAAMMGGINSMLSNAARCRYFILTYPTYIDLQSQIAAVAQLPVIVYPGQPFEGR